MAAAATLGLLSMGVGQAVATTPTSSTGLESKVAASSTSTAETSTLAQAKARAEDRKVEDLSSRTDRTQVFANPDGTFTRKSYASPVRYRDASAENGWRDIDLTLAIRADGSIGPKASPVEVSFGGPNDAGGPASLARLETSPGAAVGFGWDGGLPAPRLDGATATYADVSPGVDLKVQATPSGFEQFFVIRERPSRESTTKLMLPLELDGVKVVDPAPDTDGHQLESVAAGKVIAAISPAVTWDASGSNGAAGGNLTVAMSQVQTENGHSALVVSPDSEYLQDSATTYPVTVDPQVYLTGGAMGTSYISSDDPTSINDGGLYLPVGTTSSISYRSLIGFELGQYETSVDVLSSTLYVRNDLSSGCAPTSFSVYGLLGLQMRPSQISWDTQPEVDPALRTDVSSANGGGPDCPSDYVSVDTTPQLSAVAATQSPYFTLELRADENDPAAFKLFDSMSHDYPPVLDVTYTEPPAEALPDTTSEQNGCADVAAANGFTQAVCSPDGTWGVEAEGGDPQFVPAEDGVVDQPVAARSAAMASSEGTAVAAASTTGAKTSSIRHEFTNNWLEDTYATLSWVLVSGKTVYTGSYQIDLRTNLQGRRALYSLYIKTASGRNVVLGNMGVGCREDSFFGAICGNLYLADHTLGAPLSWVNHWGNQLNNASKYHTVFNHHVEVLYTPLTVESLSSSQFTCPQKRNNDNFDRCYFKK